MNTGLCTEHDPELWWQVGVTRDVRAIMRNQKAISICKRCPIQAKCLQYALDHDEREGVWGGATPDERRQLKRRAAAIQ